MSRSLIKRPRCAFSVPVFLAPTFSHSSTKNLSARSFSLTHAVRSEVQRGGRDKNRKRGVSAIRSTGPRQTLSVTKLGKLPRPVSNPKDARAAFEIDPNHGLWGFFTKEKEALIPSNEEFDHGRAWTEHELSKKGWQDLHKLYWVCVKEVNIVRTRDGERKRLHVGYGQSEAETRIKTLMETMRNIRAALATRHYARFDAQRLLDTRNVYELFPEVLLRHVQATRPELLAEESLPDENLAQDEQLIGLPSGSNLKPLKSRV